MIDTFEVSQKDIDDIGHFVLHPNRYQAEGDHDNK